MLANGTAAFEGRALLWDYVPWEQMTKQRRGLMWALQLAHGLDRRLILPPLRFHTKTAGVYEYVRYSELFEMQPLAELHPITELSDFLAASEGRIDLVFSLLKGLPKGVVSAQEPGAPSEWVEGECTKSIEAECEVDEQGEEVCSTPLASFAGSDSGVRVRNLTCGWSANMRWDRILRARDVRDELAVAIQNIVYQIPPPPSVVPLAKFRLATAEGLPTCGWRCPYELMRSAMRFRRELVSAAHSFLAGTRRRHAEEKVRVLAVHWRRGDFLSRAGSERACYDEGTGERLFDGKTGKPCVSAAVNLTPEQLAAEVSEALTAHNASLVFLASNAKASEVSALEAALHGTPLVLYEQPADAAVAYTEPELAVIDTLVCALADAFLGTRRSMFSWNILEERVMQGSEPESGALMGLPQGTRRGETK